LMGKMVNSESTKGFKQHILRKDDDCTIEVYDKEVKFVSPSGTSTTTLSEMTFSDQSYTPRTYDISESNVLENDQQLKRGAYITSPSGLFQLIFQEDSNLVLYTKGGYPMWATATDKKDGTYAIMQADGNLVIYNDQDKAIWGLNNEADHFTFVKNAKLTLQDDGNLVLYKPDGSTAIWATGTNIF
ncbi:MAG: hypothetical protein MRY78_06445, partial [Saprospiraceae bacterium]|nr:hypothetical protein [Saprospiraceae bacterium]